MAPTAAVDVSNTLGAAYIGAIFTFMYAFLAYSCFRHSCRRFSLFGFTSLQSYIYFHLYPHDRTLQKMLVRMRTVH